MKQFTERTFSIPTLKGISQKTIDEHLKLYAGYVKHANLILQKVEELKGNEEHAYALSEAQRRFGFEFDGIRNHERYFAALEGGATPIDEQSDFAKKVTEDFGSFDAWLARFKTVAMTRGIGWAMCYYDAESDQLLNAWVDEQHLGHLTGLVPVLALDMWEHSYVADYQPSGKKQYVEDFFANINWSVIADAYSRAKASTK
jgi:Fe-Mn family superoxide dismutase